MSLLDLFDELESSSSAPKILKSPFGWPGGKARSVQFILPHLPHRGLYCEPFGGSGVVLLSRPPSKLDILNDRYSGVVDFYRCLRDRDLCDKLIARLEMTVNSREEWMACTQWDVEDPVERAARWYYMIEYSFGSLGRVWGRARGGTYTGINGKIRSKLKYFWPAHHRMHRVQLENMDGIECMREYDCPNGVFYVDPPYLGIVNVYKHGTNDDYHRRLLRTIFDMEAFVALSGYPNPLYDEQDWDDIFEWESFVSIQGVRATEGNNLEGIPLSRGTAVERLWIKEAR